MGEIEKNHTQIAHDKVIPDVLPFEEEFSKEILLRGCLSCWSAAQELRSGQVLRRLWFRECVGGNWCMGQWRNEGRRKVISTRRKGVTKWDKIPECKIPNAAVSAYGCFGSYNLRSLPPVLVGSKKAVVGSSTVVKREKRSN